MGSGLSTSASEAAISADAFVSRKKKPCLSSPPSKVQPPSGAFYSTKQPRFCNFKSLQLAHPSDRTRHEQARPSRDAYRHIHRELQKRQALSYKSSLVHEIPFPTNIVKSDIGLHQFAKKVYVADIAKSSSCSMNKTKPVSDPSSSTENNMMQARKIQSDPSTIPLSINHHIAATSSIGYISSDHVDNDTTPLLLRSRVDVGDSKDEKETKGTVISSGKRSSRSDLNSVSIDSDVCAANDRKHQAALKSKLRVIAEEFSSRNKTVEVESNQTTQFGEPSPTPFSEKPPRPRTKNAAICSQQNNLPSSRPIHTRPRVLTSNNCKVTMLDDKRKVFVIDLVSKETCELIRYLTEDHLLRMDQSKSNDKTWRTLYTYTKMDMPCNEVTSLSMITNQIMIDIINIVGDVFGNRKAARKLRPRSYKEPHLLLYQKVKGKPEHVGVEMHYDGCAITFNLMLSDLEDYQGGGTYMRAMRTTIKLRIGQCLVHPGELYHSGIDIMSGTRFLIVGFLDGFDPFILDESTQANDREEYQRNIIIV